jgi:hypothetical protein
VVGRYACKAWGIEIDRVKTDRGNAFMRYAARQLKAKNSAWGQFDVPHIRCAPIEEVLPRRFYPGHGLTPCLKETADMSWLVGGDCTLSVIL